MQSELLVRSLIKSCNELLGLVANELGIYPEEEKLNQFLNATDAPMQLANILYAHPEKVFAQLKKIINEFFQVENEITFVPERHMFLLIDYRGSGIPFSEFLDCQEDEVFAALFDPLSIFQSIHAIAPEEVPNLYKKEKIHQPLNRLTESVFLRALKVFKNHHNNSTSLPSALIDKHLWLRGTARIKLKNFAMGKGHRISKDSDMLAFYLDNHSTYEKRKKGLDTLGIISIQQRLQWIIQQGKSDLKTQLDAISHPNFQKSKILYAGMEAPALAWKSFLESLSNETSYKELLEYVKEDLVLFFLLLEANLPDSPANELIFNKKYKNISLTHSIEEIDQQLQLILEDLEEARSPEVIRL